MLRRLVQMKWPQQQQPRSASLLLLLGYKTTATRKSTVTFSSLRFHSEHKTGNRDKPSIHFTFVLPDGQTEVPVTAYEGQTLVDVTTEHDICVEAACAQSCACSTCHMYLADDVYDKLEEPSDKENDMLDLAFHCDTTSRLGCQVAVAPWMAGMKVRLPKATRNMAVDGYVAKPH